MARHTQSDNMTIEMEVMGEAEGDPREKAQRKQELKRQTVEVKRILAK